MRGQRRAGFTLLELLVGLMIVMPALLGIIALSAYLLGAGESAAGITTAIQDAHAVLEDMRNTSGLGLAQVVAAYPSGGVVAGFTNLPNEQVVVSYPSATADPLQVTVTVNWTVRNRNMTRSMMTLVTQR